MVKSSERAPRKVYFERFILMSLLLVPAVFLQGTRTVFVAVLSVFACMMTDLILSLLQRKKYDVKDTAVMFWGLAAGLMMPATVPVGIILLSSILCVAVGKHLFGGSDNIIFSPPAISTAFLIICYPSDMLYFAKYGEKVNIFSEFTGTFSRSIEYSLNLRSVPAQSAGDALMGLVSGPIATVYVSVIAVCGICMMFHKSSDMFVTLPCVLTAGFFAFIFPRAGYSGWTSVSYELSSGYLLFGTVFLAGEPYRIPQRTAGKIIYGIMLGYTAMMFRFFGRTEGSFLFALLIICAIANSFDRVVENVIYWKKTYINTFEKSKTQIQRGSVKLTDTQEIVLPEKYRYNTPPIDGKITSKKRSGKKPQETAQEDKNHEQK